MRRDPATLSFLDFPGPMAFAHRGGDEVAPENTLEAFEAAVRMGYQYLETDVHFTRGGELVAFHDVTLNRVLGHDRTIAELSVAERKAVRIQRDGKSYQLPLLSELLEHFPQVRFNIDAKAAGAVEPLIAALKKHHALRRVCVVSFSHRRLQQMRQLAPEVCSAMSPYEIGRLWLTAKLPLGSIIGRSGDCVELPLHQRVGGRKLVVTSKRLVDLAHARGRKVHVWTINNEADMQYLLDIGVDGIMTDKPSLLKTALKARGQWVDTPVR